MFESGHLVYVAAGTLRAVPFDLSRLAVRGPAVPVVPRLVTTRSGAGEFGVARDGTLVYVDVTAGSQSARARTLVWVDRTGKEERIAAPTRSYEAPRISPDGKQLALAITDQEGDIWVWDLVRGGDLRRLTFDPGVDTFPVWTPDSHRIVFSSQSGGALNLWWKAANGTGPAEQLTTSANNQWPTSVSSDGKQVVTDRIDADDGPRLDAADARRKPSRDARCCRRRSTSSVGLSHPMGTGWPTNPIARANSKSGYGRFRIRVPPNIRSRPRAARGRSGPTTARSCSSSARTAR